MVNSTLAKKNQNTPSLTFGDVRALMLLVGLLALLGFIYLGQNGQATMTGRRTQDLQAQRERLKRENAQLQVEIAQFTNPNRLAARAIILGLHPATDTQKTYYTVKNFPNESKSSLVLPPITASVVPPMSGAEVLWNALLERLGLLPVNRAVEATSP
jgi:cell division protein FtsL